MQASVSERLHLQLRARRALLLFNDVPLRTRRALLQYNVNGDSALLVLNGTLSKHDIALLALNWQIWRIIYNIQNWLNFLTILRIGTKAFLAYNVQDICLLLSGSHTCCSVDVQWENLPLVTTELMESWRKAHVLLGWRAITCLWRGFLYQWTASRPPCEEQSKTHPAASGIAEREWHKKCRNQGWK